MDIEKYNDYRNGVHSGENAEDALGATLHIAETLSPLMLVALLNGNHAEAQSYAEAICDEAAKNYAETVEGRDPGELADEEYERRKDRARDDNDFFFRETNP